MDEIRQRPGTMPRILVEEEMFGRQTAGEVVLDALRKAILRGDLPGGTRLVQSSIAKQLGVSTTPVREALRDLSSEGLVQMDAYRGAVVQQPSLEEAREIYEMRTALEPLAIRRSIARIRDEEIDKAAAIQDALDAESDPGVWVRLNQRFHGVFIQAVDAPRMVQVIQNLQGAAAIHVALSIKARPRQMTGGNIEHHQILDSFRARDADTAVAVTIQHLASTLEAIELFHNDEA